MPKVIFRSNELIEFRRNRQCPADCMGRNCYGRCIVLTEEEINEAFTKVPPILQKVVGSPNQLREWAIMDSETVNSVIQSNFMRSYKAKAAQEREYAMLPESTKRLIAGLAERMVLTDKTDSEKEVNYEIQSL